MSEHQNISKTIKKRSHLRRWVVDIVSLIIIVLVVWQAYLFFLPHARLNFTAYTPAGRHVQNATEVLYDSKLGFLAPQVHITYDLPGEHLWVYQQKVDAIRRDCVKADNTTCNAYTTPAGQAYTLETEVNTPAKNAAGQSDTYQAVTLVRDHTYVQISSSGTNFYWDRHQWDQLIDSLQPAELPNLPIRREQPGP